MTKIIVSYTTVIAASSKSIIFRVVYCASFMKFLFLTALLVSLIYDANAQRNLHTSQSITSAQAIDEKVFFAAEGPEVGLELHVIDRNTGSAQLVKDINPGYYSSSPAEFTVFNNELFFVAHSSDYGQSIWKSDGTPEGTQMIYSVANAFPAQLTVFKGMLYFTTDLGDIMRTDGTAGGTHVFHHSSGWGRVRTMVMNADYLYFTYDGRTIYRDDGINRMQFLGPLSWESVYFKHMFALDGHLVVIKSSSYDETIRIYSLAESAMTEDLQDEWPVIKKLDAPIYGRQENDNFTVIGDKLFFSFRTYYDNVPPADELWVTDGSEGGTQMLKSFGWQPHFAESEMMMFFSFKEKLFFRAGDAGHRAMWTSDGTPNGTYEFHNVVLTRRYNDEKTPVFVGDENFYFSGDETTNDAELWISDGTPAGTKELLDIEDSGGSHPHDITAANDAVYFITTQQYTATLWSIAPSADISVQMPGGNAIPSGTTPYLFHNVQPGTCATTDLVIVNKGMKELYLNKLVLAGSGFYLVQQDLPEKIGALEAITVQVVANPLQEGTSESILSIFSNDIDEPKYVINLLAHAVRWNNSLELCDFSQGKFIKSLTPQADTKQVLLTNASIAEGLPPGTPIGLFSLPDALPGLTYTFAAGEGDEDNARFTIVGNELKSAIVFDTGVKALYTIRVRASTGIIQTESSFRINIRNVGLPPEPGECKPQFDRMSFVYHDMESNAQGHIFVGASNGKILRSMDSGRHWEVVYSAEHSAITNITFKGETGYAQGRRYLLKSEDGGASWFQIFIPLSGEYYWGNAALFFFDSSTGYVGTEEGEIFFTEDGGRTWETRSTPSWNEFRRLNFVSMDKGYGVSGWGDLVLTEDGGRTWKEVDLSPLGWSNNVHDVSFVNINRGFLLRDDKLFVTSDGGNTWTEEPSVQSYGLNRIKFYDENIGFLFGAYSGGSIYATSDGGSTWTAIGYGNVTGIAKISNKIFVARAGLYSSNTDAERSIEVSSDGGITWSTLHNSSDGDLYDIEFLSDGKGFALGEDGLFATEDNGLTWRSWPVPLQSIGDAKFVDENTVIFLSDGDLYKSTDGGITVRKVLTTARSETYLAAGPLYLAPGDVLFSISWWAFYRSEDLGETWELIPTDRPQDTEAVHFITPAVGYRIELFGSLEKTTDGGKTWVRVFAREPGTSDVFNALYFLTESHGYAGGDYLRRTNDGGITWEKVDWPLYGIIGIHFSDEQHGYVVGRGGRVWETTNGGATWQDIFYSSQIFCAQFKNGKVYVAGEGGMMASTSPSEAPPMPGYIFGPERVCAGDVVQYMLPTYGTFHTQWSTTAGNLEDHAGSVMIRFTESGEHTITATHVNSCGTSASRSATVFVGEPAVPTIEGPNPSGPGKRAVPYKVTSSNDLNSVFWAVEGSSSFEANSEAVLVDWASTTVEGTIRALTVDKYGCRANSEMVVEMDVTLDTETNPAKYVSVYPNPFEQNFTIASDRHATLLIRIIDNIGRELVRTLLHGAGEQQVDASHLPAGLYLVEVSDGKFTSTKKIIKE